MTNLKDKKLALFMTRGMSLKKWHEAGIYTREMKYYEELAKNFGEIYIFSYGANDAKYAKNLPENIKIVSRPVFCPVIFYLFLMPIFNRRILRNVNILKTNQIDGAISAVIAKRFFGKKMIVRCGYEWLQYLQNSKSSFWKIWIAKGQEKIAYKNADAIILTSKEAENFAREIFGPISAPIYIIPNYIDTEKFAPNSSVSKKEKSILFVGRLEKVKNIFALIEATAKAGANLRIVGDGSLREDLENFAKKINANVDFAGKLSQDELMTEYQKSELFVLPSFSEGNPKALLEAMSSGLSVIASHIPAHKEIIKDGENGVLCDFDVDSICGAISGILGDENIKNKLGLSARQTILEKNSLEICLQNEIYICKSFINSY